MYSTRGARNSPLWCCLSKLHRFLQDKLQAGLTNSTIKVYLASISTCQVGYGNKPVCHPLMIAFMKGVKHAKTTSRPLFPAWDLAVVWWALCKPPLSCWSPSDDP